MISKYTEYNGNSIYYATSSDTKPVAENGNMLVEADTGKVYIYNSAESEWNEKIAALMERYNVNTTEE